MARKKKYPKLPNGYGSIKKLSGKNRTNPYGVYPPTKEFDENGTPLPQKALCYVDDWYKGFTVLTWYRNGEYYPGREKELSETGDKLQQQILGILSKYNQNQRELVEQKTFQDIFMEFYQYKFNKEYTENREKHTAMESSIRTAYKNCTALYHRPFRSLVTSDLQHVIDNCTLRHASLELIVMLFNQIYKYADANDLCDKNYSKYVKINKENDDEHGEPFSENELRVLWENKENTTVELLLIMCYSGFRISAYKSMEVNLNDRYFKGGIKTKESRGRIVPIYSGIYDLVECRIKRDGALLAVTTATFRKAMYEILEILGIRKHTPHDCRHTFSMLCEKYGVNENDRKRMLGHSFSGDITNKVYGHRMLDDLREQLEKIKVCR